MRTWSDYEKHVRETEPEGAQSLNEAANYVSLIYPMVVRRGELGLSVNDLAERTGLSAATIRRVEGAGYNPFIPNAGKDGKGAGTDAHSEGLA